MSSRNKSDTNGGSKGDRSAKGSSRGDIGTPIGTQNVPVVTITTAGVGQIFPGQSCKSCSGPDTEAMVQCDLCHEWHHFSCVGVTEDVENMSWCCPKCASATGVQQTTSTGIQQFPSTSSAIGQVNQLRQASEPKLPPNTLRVTTRSAARKEINPQMLPSPVTAAEDSTALQRPDNPADSRRSEITSSGTAKSNRSQRSLMLQLQKLEEENALQREYIQKKYTILERMSSPSGSSCDGGSSRVESWIKKTNTLLEEGKLNTKYSASVNSSQQAAQSPLSNLSVHQSTSLQNSLAVAPRWTPC